MRKPTDTQRQAKKPNIRQSDRRIAAEIRSALDPEKAALRLAQYRYQIIIEQQSKRKAR